MPQHDLLLTQNVAEAGVEFTERYVNIPKGALLTGRDVATGAPLVLAPGTNGHQLVRDDAELTGLKWQAIDAGHSQNTDTGTTSQTFQLQSGSSGVKLKNNSGTFETRNAADNAYADVKGKNATFDKVTVSAAPSAGTDLTNKTYVDGLLAANDAMIFWGTIGVGGKYTVAAFNALTTYTRGWTLRVIDEGPVTIKGKPCEQGDLVMVLETRTGSGNLDSDFTVAQANIDGAVTGPAGAIADEQIAVFNNHNRSIKGSGTLLSELATTAMLNSYLPKAQYSEHSIVYANSTGVISTLVIGDNKFVGRKATGEISAMSASESRTILNVAYGATANTKCTGAEINTGTDDVKFATAKAIADSNMVKGPGTITADRIVLFNGTSGKLVKQASVGISDLLQWVSAPASKTATGVAGQAAYDGNFFYVCTATNTWKRSAIATNW